ncbi:MAG: glyceraldehyde-3-phosphate dehydrogenase [Candidatus Gracilibacteria bacterium]|jgi:glyceraldehyde 3-phosphate dehydrogenase|nr:glyceraldehyde-3-phosphate dehydrogenase [Candidatus Gracilibacteria bacterium]
MLKVGINGYGRIGRNVHRLLLDNPNIEVVAINSRADAQMRSHLLKYDSLHGRLENKISYKENSLFVDGKEIKNLAIKEASEIPWGKLGVDVVLESTGSAKTYDLASRHLEGGAKKVLVTAPMKDDTPTFVFGVNEDRLSPELNVVSNASCTTNCIAPALKIIIEEYGIKNAFATSLHSFTHSQNLLDNSGRDLRRARSAVQSLIPTTTGSIKATSKIIPELSGKLDGLAFRVPIATSSVCDVRLVLEKEATTEEINELFRKRKEEPRLKGILDVCDEQLVSIDFKTNTSSSILDTELTKVIDGKYVQIMLWYDNEWGYAARLVDILKKLESFQDDGVNFK